MERTFAHVCNTGGGRRTWLRGLENITKGYLIRVAGYNLGVLLRKAFGMRKPRTLGKPFVYFYPIYEWMVIIDRLQDVNIRFLTFLTKYVTPRGRNKSKIWKVHCY